MLPSETRAASKDFQTDLGSGPTYCLPCRRVKVKASKKTRGQAGAPGTAENQETAADPMWD